MVPCSSAYSDDTTNASAIEGREAFSKRVVGINCASNRALLEFASVIPTSKAKDGVQSIATFAQSLLTTSISGVVTAASIHVAATHTMVLALYAIE